MRALITTPPLRLRAHRLCDRLAAPQRLVVQAVLRGDDRQGEPDGGRDHQDQRLEDQDLAGETADHPSTRMGAPFA
jgi:hypothetical protein